MLILCLSIPHDTYSLHPDSTTSVLRSSLNIELINWKKNQLGHKLHRKTSPLMLSYTFLYVLYQVMPTNQLVSY